jgi:hypothetical protein
MFTRTVEKLEKDRRDCQRIGTVKPFILKVEGFIPANALIRASDPSSSLSSSTVGIAE